MKKYIQILDSVICVDDIRKISIENIKGAPYGFTYDLYILTVIYNNNTQDRFETSNVEKAKDYEALRNLLLGNNNCLMNCDECNKKILEVKYEAQKEFVDMLCDGKVPNDSTVIEAKVLLKEMWEGVML